MIVVDEYLAIRSLTGVLPASLPDEPPALTASAHWRSFSASTPRGPGSCAWRWGRFHQLAGLRCASPFRPCWKWLTRVRCSTRPTEIAAAYGNTGWRVAETLVAGLTHGRQLWFGNERNIGRRLREIADDLGVAIRLAT